MVAVVKRHCLPAFLLVAGTEKHQCGHRPFLPASLGTVPISVFCLKVGQVTTQTGEAPLVSWTGIGRAESIPGTEDRGIGGGVRKGSSFERLSMGSLKNGSGDWGRLQLWATGVEWR